jgi:serine/threonine protein kinase/tetratricopeptide (TPR) repeat protein
VPDDEDSKGPEGPTTFDGLLRVVARIDPVPASEETSLVGTTLAHYHIVAKLGQGGMGVVYKATDEKLRRDVALKVLPESFARDDERRRRFMREARSAAAVTHANIATVHDVGEASGHVFLAMELVVGETLRQRLEKGVSVEESVRIAKEIARGLGRAHERGIVHRDLKPENLMITRHGEIKILDFGLAKLREEKAPGPTALGKADTEANLTEQGRVLGTPAYMSPEQARGEPVGAGTDVFSLGAMLYEMLSGVRPFAGRTTQDTLASVLRDTPKRVSELNASVPPDVERIVERCIEKLPDGRYPSGAELLVALDAIRLDDARSAPSVRVPGAPTISLLTSKATRPTRKSVVLWLVLSIVGLVGAGLGIEVRARRMHASSNVATTRLAASTVDAEATPTKTTKANDMPPPASSSAEAIAAYEEGVRAWNDGLNSGYKSLDRALAIDPSMAAASLRLTEIYVEADQLAEARKDYREVLGHPERLSERDRAIAAALDPIVLTDPPDWHEALKRLEALHQATASDLPVTALFVSVATMEGSREQARAAAEAAVQSDPAFGLAWSELFDLTLLEGHVNDAHSIAERCLREAPRATNCLASSITLESSGGNCSAVLAGARRWIAIAPEDPIPYYLVASALAATNEAEESVEEALRESGRRNGRDNGKNALSVADRWSLAILEGDFARGATLADEFSHHLERYRNNAREELVVWRVNLAFERGDRASAARAVNEYLGHRRAFAVPDLRDDPTPFLLNARRRAGVLTPEELGSQMAEWRGDWRARLKGEHRPEGAGALATPGGTWIAGDAAVVETREEAVAALAARPPLESLSMDARSSKVAGHVSLLAQRYEEAERLEATAARSCDVLDDPFSSVRAAYELGLAREGLGKPDGACEAYRSVLARWGNAKPRSVTADKARERMKALGCAR